MPQPLPGRALGGVGQLLGRTDRDDDNSRQSMFDQASNDEDYNGNDDDDFDGDGDGFDSGDSDIA